MEQKHNSQEEGRPSLETFKFTEANRIFKPSRYSIEYFLSSYGFKVPKPKEGIIDENSSLDYITTYVMTCYTSRYSQKVAVLKSRDNPNTFAILFNNPFLYADINRKNSDLMLKNAKASDLFSNKEILNPNTVNTKREGPIELNNKRMDLILEHTNLYAHQVVGGWNQVEVHKRNFFSGNPTNKTEWFNQARVGYILIETRGINEKISALQKIERGLNTASTKVAQRIAELQSRILPTPDDLSSKRSKV
jgi:hypothetical protein